MNVPATAAGTRLDKFLAEALGSRAAAERAVAAGALVDGVARPKSHRLEGGEVVTLADEPELVVTQHELPEVPIAYEDEHLLVVDKPAGLVVHPGAGHAATRSSMRSRASSRGGDPERPGIVHRLDRDTSGLMAAARTEEAYERLSQLVRERALERTYLALVRGPAAVAARADRCADRPRPPRSDADLARQRVGARRRHALRGGGAVRPPRAAARAARDGPDAPDPGAPRRDRPAGGRRPRLRPHATPALGRQFLHAAELAFPHPITGERLELALRAPERPRVLPCR